MQLVRIEDSRWQEGRDERRLPKVFLPDSK